MPFRYRLQKVLDFRERKKEEQAQVVQKAVKVLEKHKEKQREIFKAEEKAAELKQYSELGVTRYYRQNLERQEEEEKEILKQLEALEAGL